MRHFLQKRQSSLEFKATNVKNPLMIAMTAPVTTLSITSSYHSHLLIRAIAEKTRGKIEHTVYATSVCEDKTFMLKQKQRENTL